MFNSDFQDSVLHCVNSNLQQKEKVEETSKKNDFGRLSIMRKNLINMDDNLLEKLNFIRKNQFSIKKKHTKQKMNHIYLQNNQKFKNQVKKSCFQNTIINSSQRKMFLNRCLNIQENKYQDCKIIGGGCGSSKIQIINPKQIKYRSKVITLDEKFIEQYEYYNKKDRIIKNIEQNKQGALQMEIFEQCIQPSRIHIRLDIQLYKPKLLELIDIYLIYLVTGSSLREILMKKEINELGQYIQDMKQSFEILSKDQPSLDLVFYFGILQELNSSRVGMDEQNESNLFKVVNLVSNILKFSIAAYKGDVSQLVILAQQVGQFLKESYQNSKSQQLFSHLIEIWVKKSEQFKDRIWQLSLVEELDFYITLFCDLCKQEQVSKFILLTLIKIDYLFSKIDDNNRNIIRQKFPLNCELIKRFLPTIIQKGDSKSIFESLGLKQSFLIFTVEDPTYRFLSISILLKYNEIISESSEFKEYKEHIQVYLSYKYLSEKYQSVKLAFETNKQFSEIFNNQIQNQEFKDKIMEMSKKRRQNLLVIPNLENYENKIDNENDIHKLIANNLIQKWEREVRKRQQENIAFKDDVLLEVKELYIQQSITYLAGNNIVQENMSRKISQTQIDQESQENSSTALKIILDNFLCDNKQDFNKQNLNQENNNNNRIEIKVEEQNQCKILGILAEGGTGKSMLIKKLETYLIENTNSKSENNNFYIPLLIKCNSLDPIKPLIEDYLQSQEIDSKQIDIIKNSDRNKVILLDGYDEYSGEYFSVFQKLSLQNWKNTKVIVASRREKLQLNLACAYFSMENEKGQRDETSFSIVQLEEFNKKDILDYCKRFFEQYRTKNGQFDEQQFQKDLDIINECMKNEQFASLLYLPINLYLFTRMVVESKDQSDLKEQIKSSVSDHIGIQEIFFKEQFKREAIDFISTLTDVQKKNKDIFRLIINSYFEYFQEMAIQMFKNKGNKNIVNFLQIQKNEIKISLSNNIKQILQDQQQKQLLQKISHYINSKIVTRVKEMKTDSNTNEENKNFTLEFKHKSLFEYFCARAMKHDFDIHDNIHKLEMEKLKQFKINQKSIMNVGSNQSEQQVLIKLYKLLMNDIESKEFQSNYHFDQIEKNNKYIQFIKRSEIKISTDLSEIDIGSSNLISAMFISKFPFSQLSLSFCSFSKAYFVNPKSNLISLDRCNLENAYLPKSSLLSFESCNTQSAYFDALANVFDSANIYNVYNKIWDKNNVLYTLTETGFLNAFKLINQRIELCKSKQITKSCLQNILIFNIDTILVTSKSALFLINSKNFEIMDVHKFTDIISKIKLINDKILVILKNEKIFIGDFKNKFQLLNMKGEEVAYNKINSTLATFSSNSFQIFDQKKKFELIQTIEAHTSYMLSIAFSADGKYLATSSSDKTCKIWNVQNNFELLKTIERYINFVAFTDNGKYLTTISYSTCQIWNTEKDYELIHTIQNANSFAFSVDEKYFATSCSGICKIWNAEKGFELIEQISGHTSQIVSVAFSANGKYLATGSWDQTCKIWNAEKGFELINTIKGHTKLINSVAFSADGMFLATCSKDQTCKIWNAQKEFELIISIEGHTNSISSVVFSANGKYLATGSFDKTCKIWNVQTGFELINTIQEHTDKISSVAFSADGKYLATGSQDKTLKIWNAESEFQLINTLQVSHSDATSIAFSVDTKFIAIGYSDSTCQILNVEKGFELIKTISGHTHQINSVTFSPDGKNLATGSSDRTFKIWNSEKGFELINTITTGSSKSVLSVTFSVDGKYLAAGLEDKTYKVWNLEKEFEPIDSIQGHAWTIKSVAFSVNGKYFATGCKDKTCKIWNVEKGFELIKTIFGHFLVYSLAFSEDGKFLSIGYSDGTCKICNSQKGFELIKVIQVHNSSVFNVIFSTDGKFFITGSKDKNCKIWNAEKNFEFINSIDSPQITEGNSVAVSGDGKYIATGHYDMTCKIWDLQKSYELIFTIQGHTKAVNCVGFSFDGKYLATGSFDNTCKIWNTEKDFELIKNIEYFISDPSCVAFSRDGKYLATSSYLSELKIWNIKKDFELITTIKVQTYQINSVAFSANGKYLATGNSENTCYIWNSDKGFELLNLFENQNVNSVVFSANQKYFYIYSKNNCKIWEYNKGVQLIERYSFDSVNKIDFTKDNKYLFVYDNEENFKIYNLETYEIMGSYNKNQSEQQQQEFQIYESNPIQIDQYTICENKYLI